ncbi:unnamed protein product [Rhodiola kirilowii]
MELIIPQNVIDFDFHSARTSPHASPPLTPRRFGESYFSAPTSPSRAAKIYGEYDEPIEFDFQFCGGMEMGNIFSSADDLFDGGKIRPLKTLPKLERSFKDSAAGTSFKPSKGNETEQSSPGMKKHIIDASDQRRGRAVDSHMSNSHKTAARSLYPLPVADPQPRDITKRPSESSSTLLFGKWKLRDFLLFRSASEGRASDKYPLKKFAALRKKDQEDGKSSSFRSVDSFGSESASRRKIQMSAHEQHYTKNKAASESLKKKTYLPYKQGILGRLF